MPHRLPPADTPHPITLPDGSTHHETVYLKAVLKHPNIEVGDYSYFSSFGLPVDADQISQRLAPYLYPGAPERLRIGKFCQIASGVQFVTASANHRIDGISTYPFQIFDPEGLSALKADAPDSRDTMVGHDVWIGTGALILPGARIGNGAIVGAGSVVSGAVPDYALVAGNPATVRRMRFAPEDVARLLRIAWWDWSPEQIAARADAIMAADVDALEACGSG